MTSRRHFLAACAFAAGACRLVAAATGRIRAGCQTNAWQIDPHNFPGFLEVLGRIRKLGFECFETGFRNVQPQFNNAVAARSQIEKTGLEFWAVHIFLDQGYDPRTAIAPENLVNTVIAGSAQLGARRLILSGRALAGKDAVDPGALRAKIAGLEAAGRTCRKHGMRLAYHNHDLEFGARAAEIEGLLRQTSPELVDFVLDAGHAVRAGIDVAEFFSRHHGRIMGLHLRDFRGKTRDEQEQVPLGTGEVDYSPLAAAVKKAQWSGCVLAEEERLSGVKPGESAAGPARRHIRKLFGV